MGRRVHLMSKTTNWISYLGHMTLVIIFLLLFGAVDEAQGLHLTGTFRNKDFFLFLTKFGFQKVDSNNIASTTGYIYGNISSRNTTAGWDMYFVVVDSQYFVQYYAHRDFDNPNRCYAMFSKIDTIAWDRFCIPDGKEDFLRRIPCPDGELCTEELFDPSAVIKGYQFTYHIRDQNQPR